jgi:hypothetical protein
MGLHLRVGQGYTQTCKARGRCVMVKTSVFQAHCLSFSWLLGIANSFLLFINVLHQASRSCG